MKKFPILFLITTMILAASPAFALGTYAEGQMILKITKLESSGLVFESWEGSGQVLSFNKDETCNAAENECYTPVIGTVQFSVRPETDEGNLIKTLQRKMNQDLLVKFRQHRIEAAALSTDMEIVAIVEMADKPPADLPAKTTVRKTGDKRNFYVPGRILRLEYVGTMIGTYEGLFKDGQKGKVHPFSVTDPAMADALWKSMALKRQYLFGVSQAYVTGMRKSDYDVFDLNLTEADMPKIEVERAIIQLPPAVKQDGTQPGVNPTTPAPNPPPPAAQ